MAIQQDCCRGVAAAKNKCDRWGKLVAFGFECVSLSFFYLLPAVCPLLLVTSGVSAMAALDCRVLDCCFRLCVFHCFLLAVCPL